jgi:hypothetical protein
MLQLVTKESKALPRITVTITMPIKDSWSVETLCEESLSISTIQEAWAFLEMMKGHLASRFAEIAQTTQEFERLIAFQEEG